VAIAKFISGDAMETFLIGEKHYCRIKIPVESSIVETLEKIRLLKGVVYGEPNYIYRTSLVPDDTYYNYQYAPQHCSAEKGWDITVGSPDIVIAIVDTGINGLHCEFAGKMVPGYDFFLDTPLTGYENSDNMGHGTHVSGIAAATGNNGIGIAGVAWNCRLMPVRVGDWEETDINVIKGIIFAVDNGADVINMSLSRFGYSQLYTDAVNYAIEHGVTVVSSMGNNGQSLVRYPAANQGVIAVGAIDAKDEAAHFSTRGSHISVAAPGVDIYSTSKKGEYITESGTSMSAPFVAGVCALILSVHPGITPEEVKSQLELTATDIGEPGFDEATGWGKPDIEKALGPLLPDKYGGVKVDTTPDRPGVSVVLYDVAGNMAATTRADEYGNASFYCLDTGTYIARAYDYVTEGIKDSLFFNVTAGNITYADISGFGPPPLSTLLEEDFEGSFPPSGWTDNSSDGNWTKGTDDNQTGGSGGYGITSGEDTSLLSPEINLPAGSEALLVFRYDVKIPFTADCAELDISFDGGITWINLSRWSFTSKGVFTAGLASYGGKDIILRWHYTSENSGDNHWQIDDVYLYPYPVSLSLP